VTLREIIAADARDLLSRVDDFAEEVEHDPRTDPSVPGWYSLRGVVDRIGPDPEEEADVVRDAVIFEAAIGGDFGWQTIPDPKRGHRMRLAFHVGQPASIGRIVSIVRQDDAAIAVEVQSV